MFVRTLSIFLGCALAAPTVARADAFQDQSPTIDDARTQTAREVFLAAVDAVHRGDWLEARELYARSYSLRPASTTLYSLAVAQRETGDLVKAIENFRAFLALEPNAQSLRFREPAERALDDLERRIARVTIVLQPKKVSGVAIQLDGSPIKAETERYANPGLHTVEASAPGYHARVLSVRVAPGDQERLVITLNPIARPDRVVESPPPPNGPPVVPLVALGLGSFVLSAGVTTGVVGVVMASNADTQAEATESRRIAIAGDVIAATGALAAGLGLALLIGELVADANDNTQAARVTATSDGLRVAF